MLCTDIRLRVFVDDGERKAFDVRLDLWIGECTPNESLDIEDGVVGIQNSLSFGSVADEAVGVGEGHVRGRAEVTLVIGNNLDPVVIPYGYTAVVQDQSVVDANEQQGKQSRSKENLPVGGPQINTDRPADRHVETQNRVRGIHDPRELEISP